MMIQAFKITLTIMVVIVLIVAAWSTVDEIIHFENWRTLATSLFWLVVSVIDICMLWFS